jgi:hypothetical protein
MCSTWWNLARQAPCPSLQSTTNNSSKIIYITLLKKLLQHSDTLKIKNYRSAGSIIPQFQNAWNNERVHHQKGNIWSIHNKTLLTISTFYPKLVNSAVYKHCLDWQIALQTGNFYEYPVNALTSLCPINKESLLLSNIHIFTSKKKKAIADEDDGRKWEQHHIH